MEHNPIGLDGLEFIEFCGPSDAHLMAVFEKFGFHEVAQHKSKKIKLFRQGDINFVLNSEPQGFSADFKKLHGPSVCSTGFRVKNSAMAFKAAVARGARPYKADAHGDSWAMPAIYGIGDSLIYFVDEYTPSQEAGRTKPGPNIYDQDFNFTGKEKFPAGKGFRVIDHMTNNVPVGEMQKWCDFYEKVMGFTMRRYFDIKGKSTGLISKVMKSPCGKFAIPINEPTDPKSQIQEYLDEYHGSGIQHIALITTDICEAVETLNKAHVEFLDRPVKTYYQNLPDRLPNMREDVPRLEKNAILVDGDAEGYLLQIFTKNQVGPVFIELIQRKGHDGFGEGNFQALFDSIEADQRARGVL